MGQDWLEVEYGKAETQQHPLVRLIRDSDFAGASRLIESACDSFLRILPKDPHAGEKARSMGGRLRSREQCEPALTELFEISRLSPLVDAITCEPRYPSSGPDLLVTKGRSTFYEEIATIIGVEEQLDFDIEVDEFTSRLKRVPTGRTVYVEYNVRLGVHDAVRLAKRIASQLTRGEFPEECETVVAADSPASIRILQSDAELRRMARPNVLIRIGPSRGDKALTSVPTMHPLFLHGRHDSIRRVLSEKTSQLPSDDVSVVLLDAPAPFSFRDLQDVLYGELKVDIPVMGGGPDSVRFVRDGPRLIDVTARLSGVVLQHSGVEMDGSYHFRRQLLAISSARRPLPDDIIEVLTANH